MDYFGEVLDEITELYERIEFSPHAADGHLVLKALEKAMKMAVSAERERTKYDTPAAKIDPWCVPTLIAPDFSRATRNTAELKRKIATKHEKDRTQSVIVFAAATPQGSNAVR